MPEHPPFILGDGRLHYTADPRPHLAQELLGAVDAGDRHDCLRRLTAKAQRCLLTKQEREANVRPVNITLQPWSHRDLALTR